MTWNAPMTATANSVWLASQYNTYVRDNMLVSEANIVSAANQMIISTGANALAARTPNNAVVATSQTTTSTSFTDLATVGPQVTITTGTAAFVHVASQMVTNSAGANCRLSYGVTGATTITASITHVMFSGCTSTTSGARIGAWHYVSNLNAGSNIFTMKYRVSAGTGTFVNREMVVFPL